MQASTRFDFAVRDDAGRTRAIVEAKRSLGTNAAWAAQLRRNWMSHGLLPDAEVFVLVLPDRLYMWLGSPPAGALPDIDVDAGPLFAPYFERVNTTPEQIYPEVFEMVVAWWLEDLADPRPPEDRPTGVPPQLHDAVTGGRIVPAVAA